MQRIGVGVCLLVVREKKILVAERIGEHGKGFLAVPGGELNLNERWETCALRELYEEAGIGLKVNIRQRNQPPMFNDSNVPLFVTNNMLSNGSHWVTVWIRSDWVAGEAINVEPLKKREWGWMTLEELTNDSRMRHGKESWLGSTPHDALHWMPLPELYKFRERIGL